MLRSHVKGEHHRSGLYVKELEISQTHITREVTSVADPKILFF